MIKSVIGEWMDVTLIGWMDGWTDSLLFRPVARQAVFSLYLAFSGANIVEGH